MNSAQYWKEHGNSVQDSIDLYISKDGNDANDGLTEKTPFLTVDRLWEAVAKLRFAPYSNCNLHFGAGNWGDVTINNSHMVYTLTSIDSTVGTNSNHAHVPIFRKLIVRSPVLIYAGNVEVQYGELTDGAQVWTTGYFRCRAMSVNSSCRLGFQEDTTVDVVSGDTTANALTYVFSCSGLIEVSSTINIVDSLDSTVSLFSVSSNGCLSLYSQFSLTGTFTGQHLTMQNSRLIGDYSKLTNRTVANSWLGDDLIVAGNITAGETITGDKVLNAVFNDVES